MFRFRRVVCASFVVLVVACAGAPPPPPPRPPASTSPDPSDPPEPPLGNELSSPESAAGSEYSSRGWLGVEVARSEAEAGVLVKSVVPSSPAEHSGLKKGDRILKLDGETVSSPEDVVRLVGARPPGARLGVVVAREQAQRLFSVELAPAPDDTGVMRMSYVGSSAPALEALDAVQGSVTPTLASLRGKVLVLEFWAPWCTACRFLVPSFNEWHARWSAQGVVLLGITMEPVVAADRAAQQLGMLYPIASDRRGKTTVAYRANALPTVFVIDRRGTVRDVMVGYSAQKLASVEALVARLVREP